MTNVYSAIKSRPEACHPPQDLQQRSWLQHSSALIPILIIYFVLALYRIDHQSLWVDEIITVMITDPNKPFLAWKRWFGGRGPLYPGFIQLWPKWGNVEFAFRSFSVLLGGITVCFAYVLARRLYGQRVAWISAILFATSPFLIWYSQEARYINLGIVTALFSMYTFHVALSAKRVKWWLLYCCSAILAIAAFVVNLLLPVAYALWTMCTASGRANWRRSLICQLVVLILFAWWANNGNIREVDGYWIRLIRTMTPSSVEGIVSYPTESVAPLFAGGSRDSKLWELPYSFFSFSTGFSLGPALRELHISRSWETLTPYALTLTVSTLLFGGLFITGLAVLWRQPDTAKLLTFLLAIPVLAAIVTAAMIPNVSYNVRYVCMAFPAYLFVLAAGIGSFHRPTVRLAMLAAVLSINGVSLANYYHNPRYAREDARAAARYLESAAQPPDVVVVVGSPLPIQYYYRGSLPVLAFNGRSRETDAAQYLQTLRKDHDRVWLVEIRPWQTDPQRHLKAALDSVTRPEHKTFPGVNVYTYDLTKS